MQEFLSGKGDSEEYRREIKGSGELQLKAKEHKETLQQVC